LQFMGKNMNYIEKKFRRSFHCYLTNKNDIFDMWCICVVRCEPCVLTFDSLIWLSLTPSLSFVLFCIPSFKRLQHNYWFIWSYVKWVYYLLAIINILMKNFGLFLRFVGLMVVVLFVLSKFNPHSR
jgi:hypothetical protein